MSEPTSVVLEARGLRRGFGEGPTRVEVLKDLDFALHSGERVAIVGASGSGKSTLLHLLGTVDRPDEGAVLVRGRDVRRLREREIDDLRNACLGFVYQMHHLLPEFTALENVCLPLWIRGEPDAVARGRALELLQRVGLGGRPWAGPDSESP